MKESEEINFNIKSRKDLERVLKLLSDQGFGYTSDYEHHNKKIDSIISKANKLGIETKNLKIRDTLSKLNNYEDMEKEADAFFSKYNPVDKINEYLNEFDLSSDASCRTPWRNSSYSKEIIEWVEFRRKLNLKDEYGYGQNITYYNFDKNFLKIRFGEYKSYDFKRLYKLVFNEECKEFGNKTSEWYDLGKIEIKFFQNGYANIKGDIKTLKEYYYNHTKKKIYNTTIIKYNNKTEIIKKISDL